MILEAAALFHEQGDTKFGQDLATNEASLRQAMKQDQIPAELQEAVLELIEHCSFKKRHLWVSKPKLVGLMDLLCAADLAEAVDEYALSRSYGFHRRRLAISHGMAEMEVEPREIWKRVCEFYYSTESDGYRARLAAIRVQKIRDELQGAVEHNDVTMAEICRLYLL